MLPPIDIIFGGFPCQDISVAGRGEGLAGERSGLFFEIVRLTKEIHPTFVFLENVPAIRTRGLREVARAFTDLRYDCRWTCVSAAEVGAPHQRKRWFLLAYASGARSRVQQRRGGGASWKAKAVTLNNGAKESLADAESERLEGLSESEMERKWTRQKPTRNECIFAKQWWAVEPNVGRVAYGVPFRVDRLRGLGNAVVPSQANKAFKKLLGMDAK
jgi:DNA (cytosine-5)-methyltransferase 1